MKLTVTDQKRYLQCLKPAKKLTYGMYEEQLQMNKKKTGNLNRKIGKGYKWTDHLKRSPLASKCRNQRCAPESEK